MSITSYWDLYFNRSIVTRLFRHASTQELLDIVNEVELGNRFLHSSTHVDFDVNIITYSDLIHIFDVSTSYHEKQIAIISTKHRIRKENKSQSMDYALQT